MKPLLPDTNVLVYETVEDSSKHEGACEIIDSMGRIILPSIVLRAPRHGVPRIISCPTYH